MTNQDKEREEFELVLMEKWFQSEKPSRCGDQYIYDSFTCAWQGWQASAARSAQRIAEVKARYESEECCFNDPVLLTDHAERYSLSMPDSHAKVVMHELAKLNKSRIAELQAEVYRLTVERRELLSCVVAVASEFVGGEVKITYRKPDEALDYIKQITTPIKTKYQAMKGFAR